jgi:ABC-type transport system involved in multi-copper enzyme maturation permease subunit
VTWHGIQTVARLELRQRARASRWAIVLGIWFAAVALVTVLSYWTMHDPLVDSGASMCDIVIFFVLGLGMLVVPSLTATSINGDREHGVLATLQTTLLTSADIVLGKLAAAWAIAAAFLATALPFLVWAWLEGGISIGRILLSLLVLLLVLAVVCAIGLMFSTLTARPVSSAVLTYLAMGALVFGTVIGFGLTAFLVTEEQTVRVYGIPDDWWEKNNPSAVEPPGTEPLPMEPREPTRADCTTFERVTSVAHTERIWWMLPLNPFVVVADAAPSRPGTQEQMYSGFTPMRWISAGAREARRGATDEVLQECYIGTNVQESPEPLADAAQRESVWPYGLGFLLASGLGATLVAERRLHTPIRRLPNGTRIA